MWPFDKPKNTVEASGLTSLERQASAVKIAELEMRIVGLEQAIFALCDGLRYHIQRMDSNTQQLDKNMHSLAVMTLRPYKDLLGGDQESN